jgi:hypothetical protein
MALTANLYPSQTLSPETLRGWAVLWITLAEEFGPEMMDKAVARHMLNSKFFPLPAELREHLEALRSRDRARAAYVAEKFVPCEKETGGGAQLPGNGTTCCGGQIFFWARYNGQMERYAKDCQCKIDWRAGYPSKKQPALAGADSKAKAAGE